MGGPPGSWPPAGIGSGGRADRGRNRWHSHQASKLSLEETWRLANVVVGIYKDEGKHIPGVTARRPGPAAPPSTSTFGLCRGQPRGVPGLCPAMGRVNHQSSGQNQGASRVGAPGSNVPCGVLKHEPGLRCSSPGAVRLLCARCCRGLSMHYCGWPGGTTGQVV